ncbi:hypothetical protein DFH06DRAFT_1371048 [Mycena polygramma]|nr:hypothetical protein DFH06DRAFT_1371048 [Mycena polygramma]
MRTVYELRGTHNRRSKITSVSDKDEAHEAVLRPQRARELKYTTGLAKDVRVKRVETGIESGSSMGVVQFGCNSPGAQSLAPASLMRLGPYLSGDRGESREATDAGEIIAKTKQEERRKFGSHCHAASFFLLPYPSAGKVRFGSAFERGSNLRKIGLLGDAKFSAAALQELFFRTRIHTTGILPDFKGIPSIWTQFLLGFWFPHPKSCTAEPQMAGNHQGSPVNCYIQATGTIWGAI